MKQYKKLLGHSLVELLTILSLMTFLIGIAINQFTAFKVRLEAQRVFYHLEQAIVLGRSMAQTENETCFICPINMNTMCGHDWNKGFMLAINKGQSKVRILKKYPGAKYGYLEKGAFYQGLHKLVFKPQAPETLASRGHFTYYYQGKIMGKLMINQNMVYQTKS